MPPATVGDVVEAFWRSCTNRSTSNPASPATIPSRREWNATKRPSGETERVSTPPPVYRDGGVIGSPCGVRVTNVRVDVAVSTTYTSGYAFVSSGSSGAMVRNATVEPSALITANGEIVYRGGVLPAARWVSRVNVRSAIRNRYTSSRLSTSSDVYRCDVHITASSPLASLACRLAAPTPGVSSVVDHVRRSRRYTSIAVSVSSARNCCAVVKRTKRPSSDTRDGM
jgi:hypothetical protein